MNAVANVIYYSTECLTESKIVLLGLFFDENWLLHVVDIVQHGNLLKVIIVKLFEKGLLHCLVIWHGLKVEIEHLLFHVIH